MPSLPLAAAILSAPSLAADLPPTPADQIQFEERHLLLTLPEAPQHGISWVVRFPGCDAMQTEELLRILDDPPLTRAYRERQEHAMKVGVIGTVVGQALILGGFATSAGAAFNYPTEDDRWVPIGLGIVSAGLVLDYATIHHFLRYRRRERHPAAWLDVRDAAVEVQRFNESRGLEPSER